MHPGGFAQPPQVNPYIIGDPLLPGGLPGFQGGFGPQFPGPQYPGP